uniref:HPL n=1 Tax=Arundo donax TaxID=35708 RepID=A0A0A8Y0F5_ARUDO
MCTSLPKRVPQLRMFPSQFTSCMPLISYRLSSSAAVA